MANATLATVAPSVAKTTAITGTVISVAGNCMMPSKSVANASNPAPGIPLIRKATPISSI